MTNATLRGKPDAGNPHVRFDEGEVASAKPRRGSLLYMVCKMFSAFTAVMVAAGAWAYAPRTYDVRSDAMGKTVPVAVLLPKGYDANPARRYPLVILLHGAS